MRTTLAIDDDVLAAARALAEQQHQSLGEAVSALARKGLAPAQSPPTFRNGIRLLPVRPDARPVTLEMVNKLRDEIDGCP